MHVHKLAGAIGAALAVSVLTSICWGAEAVQTGPQTGESIAEVLVTAQRRAESLQDVPLAITALSGDQLERAGIRGVEDLITAVPGLQIANGLGPGSIYLRGVGTNNQLGENSVAMYVDDVYYAAPIGVLMDLDNVERVEVLKGPQGTLYGRNATGGLINIITPEPQARSLLQVKAGYDDYQAINTSLYATGGLSDHLKASLAVSVHDQRRGYGRNLALNEEASFVKYQSYRGKLLWEPTAADRVTLAAIYYRDPSSYGSIGTNLPGTFSVSGATYSGSPWDTTEGLKIDPLQITKTGTLTWQHTFSDSLLLKSISAYRTATWHSNKYVGDEGPTALYSFDQSMNTRSIQQELLLQGSTAWLDRSLEYTVGVFYFDYRIFPYTFDFLTGAPDRLAVFYNSAHTRNESFAVYGQGDYHLTARDTLTVGLRYTHERASANAQTAPSGQPVVAARPDAANFADETWRLALKHRFSDSWMAYGSISKGFKSGLFDAGNQTPAGIALVKPETLYAYELGIKGSPLGGRVQLGVNAFYYDYKDLQIQSLSGLFISLTNAASAKVYGADVEGAVAVPVPVGDFKVRADLEILHDQYTKYPACTLYTPNAFPPGGNATSTVDCSGHRFPFIPDSAATLSVSYTVPVALLKGDVGMAATYYHSDKWFWQSSNTLSQAAYDTLNAELSYAFLKDDSVRLRLYGTNLTNAAVEVLPIQTVFSTSARYKPPRTIGGEIQYRWQ